MFGRIGFGGVCCSSWWSIYFLLRLMSCFHYIPLQPLPTKSGFMSMDTLQQISDYITLIRYLFFRWWMEVSDDSAFIFNWLWEWAMLESAFHESINHFLTENRIKQVTNIFTRILRHFSKYWYYWLLNVEICVCILCIHIFFNEDIQSQKYSESSKLWIEMLNNCKEVWKSI